MIELQYFNGIKWVVVSTWDHELHAWWSLGGDDYGYRTVKEGKILTDKSI